MAVLEITRIVGFGLRSGWNELLSIVMEKEIDSNDISPPAIYFVASRALTG